MSHSYKDPINPIENFKTVQTHELLFKNAIPGLKGNLILNIKYAINSLKIKIKLQDYLTFFGGTLANKIIIDIK